MFLVIWILAIIWFIGSISRGVGFSLECHVLHHFLQLVPHHFQFYVYAQKKRFRLVNGRDSFLTICGVPAAFGRGPNLCCIWLWQLGGLTSHNYPIYARCYEYTVSIRYTIVIRKALYILLPSDSYVTAFQQEQPGYLWFAALT